MADTHVTIAGNLTADPELKFTPTAPPSPASASP
jgi:single-stranded DNA-binding protein